MLFLQSSTPLLRHPVQSAQGYNPIGQTDQKQGAGRYESIWNQGLYTKHEALHCQTYAEDERQDTPDLLQFRQPRLARLKIALAETMTQSPGYMNWRIQ